MHCIHSFDITQLEDMTALTTARPFLQFGQQLEWTSPFLFSCSTRKVTLWYFLEKFSFISAHFIFPSVVDWDLHVDLVIRMHVGMFLIWEGLAIELKKIFYMSIEVLPVSWWTRSKLKIIDTKKLYLHAPLDQKSTYIFAFYMFIAIRLCI